MARNQRIFDLGENLNPLADLHGLQPPPEMLPVPGHVSESVEVEIPADPTRFQESMRDAADAMRYVDPPNWSEPLSRVQALGRAYARWLEEETARVMVELMLYGQSRLANGNTINVRMERDGPLVVSPGSDHIDGSVVEVHLDQCWKCSTSVPKDDDIGLCLPCKKAMQDFTDTPTPIAPVYTQEWNNDFVEPVVLHYWDSTDPRVEGER